MKKIYFTFLLIPLLSTAQKRHTFFIEGGRDFANGHLPSVASIAYNYSPAGKFGLGVCAEFGGHDIEDNFLTATSRSEQFGNAALSDFRYYIKFAKGTLIPVFQFGYNFFDNKSDVNTAIFHTAGGIQLALGSTYAFNISRSGFIVSTKYVYRRFKETMTYQAESLSNGYFVNGLAIMIGVRF